MKRYLLQRWVRHMKNKLWYLVKYNLNRKFKSKWFLIVNVLLFLFIPIICNIDNVIKFFGGDFNDPTTVYINNSEYYNEFVKEFEKSNALGNKQNIEIKKIDKDYSIVKSKIKDEKEKHIILDIAENDKSVDTLVISYEFIDSAMFQSIMTTLSNTKQNIFLSKSSIDKDELSTIYQPVNVKREYLSENLDEKNEFMKFLSNMLIPIFIVPIFMLIIMVVNSIGAEINEEKTSKSMEIIISSVSPKVHFLAKIISANAFVLIQSFLLLFYGFVGIITRKLLVKDNLLSGLGINSNEIVSGLVDSGILSNILKALPLVIIMFLLTFLAYSLLAGILASMTTSIEDYQQLQTPLMLILMFAYYMAIVASTYDNALFIKILSYVPFISGILSPVLLMIGQVSFIDVLISATLLVGTNFLLVKYGLRIYKVGILNYSSSKLWKKIATAVKEK